MPRSKTRYLAIEIVEVVETMWKEELGTLGILGRLFRGQRHVSAPDHIWLISRTSGTKQLSGVRGPWGFSRCSRISNLSSPSLGLVHNSSLGAVVRASQLRPDSRPLICGRTISKVSVATSPQHHTPQQANETAELPSIWWHCLRALHAFRLADPGRDMLALQQVWDWLLAMLSRPWARVATPSRVYQKDGVWHMEVAFLS